MGSSAFSTGAVEAIAEVFDGASARGIRVSFDPNIHPIEVKCEERPAKAVPRPGRVDCIDRQARHAQFAVTRSEEARASRTALDDDDLGRAGRQLRRALGVTRLAEENL